MLRPEARPGSGKTLSQAAPPGPVYQFGEFELDADRYELRHRSMRVRLRPASMDLLLLLVERRKSLVSRDEIAHRLWTEPDTVDVDQGINTAIRRIREALRDDPAKPRFIETVVGKGYRFIAEVKEDKAAAAASAVPLPNPSNASPSLVIIPPTQNSDSVETSAAAGPHSVQTSRPDTRLSRFAWSVPAVAAFLLLLGVIYLTSRRLKSDLPRRTTSFTQITTNDTELRVTAAAISPDGKSIVYADLNGIYLRPLQSEETVTLQGPKDFRVERLSWFPDQTRLLVSGFAERSTGSQIWTVLVTGGAPQLLRQDAASGIASPDGTRIAFTANKNTELWTAGAAGEGARLLIADLGGRAFSGIFWAEGGKRLSYLRSLNGLGQDDYESADADTGKILAREKGITFDSASASGTGHISFLRDAPARNRDAYSLWTVRTNSSTGSFAGAPEQVASVDEGRGFGLTVSEDGSRMSLLLEKGNPHVFLGTLQQPGPILKDVQRLTFDTKTDYPGTWLHDNQTVLFESDRTGTYQLYQQRLHEPVPQEFNTGQGNAVLPQVTPDGKWILYVVYPKGAGSGSRRLFRMPSGGGTPEQIPTADSLDEFRCPLLGGSTCVLRQTEGEKFLVYYVLDPVTGKGRELGRTPWLPHVVSDWCVAPDGSAVALTSHDTSNPRIRIVPLDGNPARPQREWKVNGFGMLSGISWSADQKGWYVAADTKTGTSLLYVDQKGLVRVLRDTPMSTWGVPSPDGRKLAFVDRAVDSNVWLWQQDASN